MCDPPLNGSHEVWPSPFGAHFYWWPSPLRPQPSPSKKNVPSLTSQSGLQLSFVKQTQINKSNQWQPHNQATNKQPKRTDPKSKQIQASTVRSGQKKGKEDTIRLVFHLGGLKKKCIRNFNCTEHSKAKATKRELFSKQFIKAYRLF